MFIIPERARRLLLTCWSVSAGLNSVNGWLARAALPCSSPLSLLTTLNASKVGGRGGGHELLVVCRPRTPHERPHAGNQLYDPMTKTPVMIVQADQLMYICGEPFIELMKQSHPVEVMQKLDDQFPLLDRLRLVPYRAVGHDHGFLLCLKPDTVIIYSKTHMIQPAKCFVGMSLSGLSADQEFQSIIHPDM